MARAGAFRLITSLQDEVHRIAISYHRKASEKKMIKSPLLDLDGVGKATYEKLMKKYKTLSKIKTLSEDELISFAGKKAGESIYNYCRQGDGKK